LTGIRIPRLSRVWGWLSLAVAGVMLGRPVLAQGNLSTQGLGYPPGEVTTATMGSGGAFGETDPVSAINPAALASWGRAAIHFQYDPEFRTVSSSQGTDHAVTVRFPLLSAGVPIGSRFVIGLSLGTLLDRSWQTREVQQVPVGDTIIAAGQTFRSTGGIEDVRLALGWKASSWFRFGVGLHALTGRNQIQVTRDFPDTTVVKTQPYSDTSTYSFSGIAGSAGVDIRPSPLWDISASMRAGGSLRAYRRDTLQSSANVPPRAGAALRYTGISGLSLAVRGDWEGWSKLDGLGSPAANASDSWEWSAGAEFVGPKVGSQSMLLRLGALTHTLPFEADGALVRENAVSGGLGIPVRFDQATIDLALQRAFRSASIDVSESAWTLSVGLTVRP
jgi:hypothetical protein